MGVSLLCLVKPFKLRGIKVMGVSFLCPTSTRPDDFFEESKSLL